MRRQATQAREVCHFDCGMNPLQHCWRTARYKEQEPALPFFNLGNRTIVHPFRLLATL